MSEDKSSRPALDEHELKIFLEDLQRGILRDKDKLKRVKALAKSNTITCAQLASIATLTESCWCDTVVEAYPALTDKDKFADVVLPVFRFDEEREEVKERLNL